MGRLSPFEILLSTTLLVFLLLFTPNDAAPFQESADSLANERGCYYNATHYPNGRQIDTTNPCLNCECMDNSLMCFLRICPFVKPLDGRFCKTEHHAGECCPRYWCKEEFKPPIEKPHPDARGCYVDGYYFEEGARIPMDITKPCEACYCIRNTSVCTLQTCKLDIDGCFPEFREGSCCPSRYNCTLDAITTVPPGVMEEEEYEGCKVGDVFYKDGDQIPSDDKCQNCYCMRHTKVCSIAKCEPPAPNCKPLETHEGECCAHKYECPEGTEIPDTAFEHMVTTEEDLLRPSSTTTPDVLSTAEKEAPFSEADSESSTEESETMFPTTKGLRRIDDEDTTSTLTPSVFDSVKGGFVHIKGQTIKTEETKPTTPAVPRITRPKFEKTVPGEGNCWDGTKTIPNGQRFESSDPCLQNCTCVSTELICDRIECVMQRLKPGCKYSKTNGQCCPNVICDVPEFSTTEETSEKPVQEDLTTKSTTTSKTEEIVFTFESTTTSKTLLETVITSKQEEATITKSPSTQETIELSEPTSSKTLQTEEATEGVATTVKTTVTESITAGTTEKSIADVTTSEEPASPTDEKQPSIISRTKISTPADAEEQEKSSVDTLDIVTDGLKTTAATKESSLAIDLKSSTETIIDEAKTSSVSDQVKTTTTEEVQTPSTTEHVEADKVETVSELEATTKQKEVTEELVTVRTLGAETTIYEEGEPHTFTIAKDVSSTVDLKLESEITSTEASEETTKEERTSIKAEIESTSEPTLIDKVEDISTSQIDIKTESSSFEAERTVTESKKETTLTDKSGLTVTTDVYKVISTETETEQYEKKASTTEEALKTFSVLEGKETTKVELTTETYELPTTKATTIIKEKIGTTEIPDVSTIVVEKETPAIRQTIFEKDVTQEITIKIETTTGTEFETSEPTSSTTETYDISKTQESEESSTLSTTTSEASTVSSTVLPKTSTPDSLLLSDKLETLKIETKDTTTTPQAFTTGKQTDGLTDLVKTTVAERVTEDISGTKAEFVPAEISTTLKEGTSTEKSVEAPSPSPTGLEKETTITTKETSFTATDVIDTKITDVVKTSTVEEGSTVSTTVVLKHESTSSPFTTEATSLEGEEKLTTGLFTDKTETSEVSSIADTQTELAGAEEVSTTAEPKSDTIFTTKESEYDVTTSKLLTHDSEETKSTIISTQTVEPTKITDELFSTAASIGKDLLEIEKTVLPVSTEEVKLEAKTTTLPAIATSEGPDEERPEDKVKTDVSESPAITLTEDTSKASPLETVVTKTEQTVTVSELLEVKTEITSSSGMASITTKIPDITEDFDRTKTEGTVTEKESEPAQFEAVTETLVFSETPKTIETVSTDDLTKETVSTDDLTKETASTDDLTKETESTDDLTKETVSTDDLTKETVSTDDLTKETLFTLKPLSSTEGSTFKPQENLTTDEVVSETQTVSTFTSSSTEKSAETESSFDIVTAIADYTKDIVEGISKFFVTTEKELDTTVSLESEEIDKSVATTQQTEVSTDILLSNMTHEPESLIKDTLTTGEEAKTDGTSTSLHIATDGKITTETESKDTQRAETTQHTEFTSSYDDATPTTIEIKTPPPATDSSVEASISTQAVEDISARATTAEPVKTSVKEVATETEVSRDLAETVTSVSSTVSLSFTDTASKTELDGEIIDTKPISTEEPDVSSTLKPAGELKTTVTTSKVTKDGIEMETAPSVTQETEVGEAKKTTTTKTPLITESVTDSATKSTISDDEKTKGISETVETEPAVKFSELVTEAEETPLTEITTEPSISSIDIERKETTSFRTPTTEEILDKVTSTGDQAKITFLDAIEPNVTLEETETSKTLKETLAADIETEFKTSFGPLTTEKDLLTVTEVTGITTTLKESYTEYLGIDKTSEKGKTVSLSAETTEQYGTEVVTDYSSLATDGVKLTTAAETEEETAGSSTQKIQIYGAPELITEADKVGIEDHLTVKPTMGTTISPQKETIGFSTTTIKSTDKSETSPELFSTTSGDVSVPAELVTLKIGVERLGENETRSTFAKPESTTGISEEVPKTESTSTISDKTAFAGEVTTELESEPVSLFDAKVSTEVPSTQKSTLEYVTTKLPLIPEDKTTITISKITDDVSKTTTHTPVTFEDVTTPTSVILDIKGTTLHVLVEKPDNLSSTTELVDTEKVSTEEVAVSELISSEMDSEGITTEVYVASSTSEDKITFVASEIDKEQDVEPKVTKITSTATSLSVEDKTTTETSAKTTAVPVKETGLPSELTTTKVPQKLSTDVPFKDTSEALTVSEKLDTTTAQTTKIPLVTEAISEVQKSTVEVEEVATISEETDSKDFILSKFTTDAELLTKDLETKSPPVTISELIFEKETTIEEKMTEIASTDSSFEDSESSTSPSASVTKQFTETTPEEASKATHPKAFTSVEATTVSETEGTSVVRAETTPIQTLDLKPSTEVTPTAISVTEIDTTTISKEDFTTVTFKETKIADKTTGIEDITQISTDSQTDELVEKRLTEAALDSLSTETTSLSTATDHTVITEQTVVSNVTFAVDARVRPSTLAFPTETTETVTETEEGETSPASPKTEQTTTAMPTKTETVQSTETSKTVTASKPVEEAITTTSETESEASKTEVFGSSTAEYPKKSTVSFVPPDTDAESMSTKLTTIKTESTKFTTVEPKTIAIDGTASESDVIDLRKTTSSEIEEKYFTVEQDLTSKPKDVETKTTEKESDKYTAFIHQDTPESATEKALEYSVAYSTLTEAAKEDSTRPEKSTTPQTLEVTNREKETTVSLSIIGESVTKLAVSTTSEPLVTEEKLLTEPVKDATDTSSLPELSILGRKPTEADVSTVITTRKTTTKEELEGLFTEITTSASTKLHETVTDEIAPKPTTSVLEEEATETLSAETLKIDLPSSEISSSAKTTDPQQPDVQTTTVSVEQETATRTAEKSSATESTSSTATTVAADATTAARTSPIPILTTDEDAVEAVSEDHATTKAETTEKPGVCVFNGTYYESGQAISTIDPCEKCHCAGGDVTCLRITCRLPKKGCVATSNKTTACCPSAFICPSDEPLYSTTEEEITTKAITTPIPISFLFSTAPTLIASSDLVTKMDQPEAGTEKVTKDTVIPKRLSTTTEGVAEVTIKTETTTASELLTSTGVEEVSKDETLVSEEVTEEQKFTTSPSVSDLTKETRVETTLSSVSVTKTDETKTESVITAKDTTLAPTTLKVSSTEGISETFSTLSSEEEEIEVVTSGETEESIQTKSEEPADTEYRVKATLEAEASTSDETEESQTLPSTKKPDEDFKEEKKTTRAETVTSAEVPVKTESSLSEVSETESSFTTESQETEAITEAVDVGTYIVPVTSLEKEATATSTELAADSLTTVSEIQKTKLPVEVITEKDIEYDVESIVKPSTAGKTSSEEAEIAATTYLADKSTPSSTVVSETKKPTLLIKDITEDEKIYTSEEPKSMSDVTTVESKKTEITPIEIVTLSTSKEITEMSTRGETTSSSDLVTEAPKEIETSPVEISSTVTQLSTVEKITEESKDVEEKETELTGVKEVTAETSTKLETSTEEKISTSTQQYTEKEVTQKIKDAEEKYTSTLRDITSEVSKETVTEVYKIPTSTTYYPIKIATEKDEVVTTTDKSTVISASTAISSFEVETSGASESPTVQATYTAESLELDRKSTILAVSSLADSETTPAEQTTSFVVTTEASTKATGEKAETPDTISVSLTEATLSGETEATSERTTATSTILDEMTEKTTSIRDLPSSVKPVSLTTFDLPEDLTPAEKVFTYAETVDESDTTKEKEVTFEATKQPTETPTTFDTTKTTVSVTQKESEKETTSESEFTASPKTKEITTTSEQKTVSEIAKESVATDQITTESSSFERTSTYLTTILSKAPKMEDESTVELTSKTTQTPVDSVANETDIPDPKTTEIKPRGSERTTETDEAVTTSAVKGVQTTTEVKITTKIASDFTESDTEASTSSEKLLSTMKEATDKIEVESTVKFLPTIKSTTVPDLKEVTKLSSETKDSTPSLKTDISTVQEKGVTLEDVSMTTIDYIPETSTHEKSSTSIPISSLKDTVAPTDFKIVTEVVDLNKSMTIMGREGTTFSPVKDISTFSTSEEILKDTSTKEVTEKLDELTVTTAASTTDKIFSFVSTRFADVVKVITELTTIKAENETDFQPEASTTEALFEFTTDKVSSRISPMVPLTRRIDMDLDTSTVQTDIAKLTKASEGPTEARTTEKSVTVEIKDLQTGTTEKASELEREKTGDILTTTTSILSSKSETESTELESETESPKATKADGISVTEEKVESFTLTSPQKSSSDHSEAETTASPTPIEFLTEEATSKLAEASSTEIPPTSLPEVTKTIKDKVSTLSNDTSEVFTETQTEFISTKEDASLIQERGRSSTKTAERSTPASSEITDFEDKTKPEDVTKTTQPPKFSTVGDFVTATRGTRKDTEAESTLITKYEAAVTTKELKTTDKTTLAFDFSEKTAATFEVTTKDTEFDVDNKTKTPIPIDLYSKEDEPVIKDLTSEDSVTTASTLTTTSSFRDLSVKTTLLSDNATETASTTRGTTLEFDYKLGTESVPYEDVTTTVAQEAEASTTGKTDKAIAKITTEIAEFSTSHAQDAESASEATKTTSKFSEATTVEAVSTTSRKPETSTAVKEETVSSKFSEATTVEAVSTTSRKPETSTAVKEETVSEVSTEATTGATDKTFKSIETNATEEAIKTSEDIVTGTPKDIEALITSVSEKEEVEDAESTNTSTTVTDVEIPIENVTSTTERTVELHAEVTETEVPEVETPKASTTVKDTSVPTENITSTTERIVELHAEITETETPEVETPKTILKTAETTVISETDTETPSSGKPSALPVTTTAQTVTRGFTDMPTKGYKMEDGTTEYPDFAQTAVDEEDDFLIDENSCIYEGRIYQSAEQIPREDPCEFCFCFRGDIICLQQSCPPPAKNCNETRIPGFCCPRYECPVYITTRNLSMIQRRKGGVTPYRIMQKRIEKREIAPVEVQGCQVNGTFYELGKTVTSTSGPCLHCVCQQDGLMHCDPKRCKLEPPLMLKMNKNFFSTR